MIEFNDIEGHWAAEDIRRVASYGLIHGFEDGSFRPEEPMSRAQATKMFRVMLDLLDANENVLEALKTIVFIRSEYKDYAGIASGCWIDEWTVLTNAHAIKDENGNYAKKIYVWGHEGAGFQPMFIGTDMEAKVLFDMDEYDLALLSAKPSYAGGNYGIDCPVITIASEPAKQTQKVWALGNPYGAAFDICKGIVRATNRAVNYWKQPQWLMGLDAPINPGNSGGALVDIKGEFVGVPSAGRMSSNNFTYAIPLEVVKEFLVKANQ